MRRLSFASLWLIVPLTAGCGGDALSIAPTTPTVVVVPTPESSQTTSVGAIRAFVQDTAGRPLAGARVEVLDGASAGTSASADSNGILVLTGSFNASTRFRVTSDGHESLTQTWTCSVPECRNNAQPWLGFSVRPLAPPVDLSGDYTLTITAAAACSTLSVESRARSLAVTLAPRMRDNTADLIGFNGEFHSHDVPERLRRFVVGVAGNFVNIGFRTGHGDEPGLIEYLGSDRTVRFIGSAAGTVGRTSTSSITFAFDGLIEDAPGERAAATAQCASHEHQLVLARRF